MYKNDAIKFFGTKSRLATAAGVRIQSLYKWGELVPEGRAMRLQAASGGALVYDPAVYDQHKQSRKEGLNHETQSAS
ncbi:TPA: transcriptional regulator [Salmonella enterica subsp. enterica serovar Enteritidis]|uniref:Cro/CI family transcriptional regulator n=1 Tax=Salmonella enterica TaxID=28901 RepID=UPI0002A680D0|nr:Cro/CI family transcriptional regulator [Salmonella enterica]ECC3255673.1 transcriptional regulator [Salmonella enterica subsp. enterica]ECG5956131.1 transcriptional regulator [Salmonella enterica subsp. enterica serovar Baguida]ELO76004.1 DNA-binding transcriptional regulator DicC [Salmonella enterica subsp. enterica serovar Enteritidis str. SARB17]EDU8875893.1 transcriptional regulator [Salmonella enterica subsp. enterica]EJE9586980.1 transcriptional regulator [Salmonella enterica]